MTMYDEDRALTAECEKVKPKWVDTMDAPLMYWEADE